MIDMRLPLIVFCCFISVTIYAAKSDFQGTWQGVIMRAGQSMDEGSVVYVDFQITDGKLSGYMREETYDTEYYAIKQIKGQQEGDILSFEQTVIQDDHSAFRSKWCMLEGEFEYDPIKGYMKGSFSSTDCGRVRGDIILYKKDFEISTNAQSHSTHSWFAGFVRDYNDGLSAPLIRIKERENFVFEPIFFDFDKAEIREEHKDFLDRLIKVVKGHSDLRVQVTGHTDSEGSNGYNDDLSKRRAEAIIQYFVENGLSKDRLKFDFKGENDPADTNDTAEGRQRNRRVDFEFIQH
ncbi:MAG: OmpA family protein [bacterium]|nr:OmpA family protein [bacterium]